MPQPDDLRQKIRELEENVRILQLENDQLAERAEDTLLLGLIAEQISMAEESGQVHGPRPGEDIRFERYPFLRLLSH